MNVNTLFLKSEPQQVPWVWRMVRMEVGPSTGLSLESLHAAISNLLAGDQPVEPPRVYGLPSLLNPAFLPERRTPFDPRMGAGFSADGIHFHYSPSMQPRCLVIAVACTPALTALQEHEQR